MLSAFLPLPAHPALPGADSGDLGSLPISMTLFWQLKPSLLHYPGPENVHCVTTRRRVPANQHPVLWYSVPWRSASCSSQSHARVCSMAPPHTVRYHHGLTPIVLLTAPGLRIVKITSTVGAAALIRCPNGSPSAGVFILCFRLPLGVIAGGDGDLCIRQRGLGPRLGLLVGRMWNKQRHRQTKAVTTVTVVY
ncbi:hypothetical protein T10_9949 [Trichinella papuae]|uniref:Uncharacterized protein n=1 Tax=Trichinella papuae TaxID=268474 RepID=A0A0V1N1N2_9BILA|nr:hypothetical protein T10_9949 [Trichinella papuae]